MNAHPGIQAVIFDMDGLLIDSMPLWREAEEAIFRHIGVPLSASQCFETAAMRREEAIAHWYRKFSVSSPAPKVMEARLLATVVQFILQRGEPMPGAHELVTALHARGMKLAIASNSPIDVIQAVVAKLALHARFDVMHSGEDERHGKPHPAVYLSAAASLGVSPAECIAFEDSVSGVQSAKAAGIKVVAVPAQEDFADPGYEIADVVVRSLRDFSLDMLEC